MEWMGKLLGLCTGLVVSSSMYYVASLSSHCLLSSLLPRHEHWVTNDAGIFLFSFIAAHCIEDGNVAAKRWGGGGELEMCVTS